MPQFVNRRDFLALAGIGGAAAVLVPRGLRAVASPRPGQAPGNVGQRVLVMIEMAGGNDGLSMAPPLDAQRLADRRPESFPDLAALLRPGDDVVLNPALQQLQHRPLTVVEGLGTPNADGSHFEMLRRWWAGDPDGSAGLPTGFLGRLCDALDTGAPVTGLSIGGASTPSLLAERAGTLGLPDPGWLWWMAADPDDGEDEWAATFRDGLGAMAEADDGDGETLALARRNLAGGLRVGEMVTSLGEPADDDGNELAGKLSLAARVIAADVGVRVVHVPMDGDFDTHENHRDRHTALMTELDGALESFLASIEEAGLADQVLVATMSEFGRRPEENASRGLDHGTASSALLAGAVPGGRVGEPVDLEHLDDDGNLVAPISMDRYYATLAETWFEIDAADVLPGTPEPLAGIW